MPSFLQVHAAMAHARRSLTPPNNLVTMATPPQQRRLIPAPSPGSLTPPATLVPGGVGSATPPGALTPPTQRRLMATPGIPLPTWSRLQVCILYFFPGDMVRTFTYQSPRQLAD